MYRQTLDPVAHSLAWSSAVAVLPLLVLFVLLGVVRLRAWIASLIALAAAFVIALAAYGMPTGQTLLAASEGAAFGFFPILWIVINAIWVYLMTVETGHFDVLRRSFTRVSDDQRIQAVIIAFSFGALMEALAGFGTPVAVTSVMLIALGFRPLKAATLALVANTAPVAFGAMATPIITLGKVTGISTDTLGSMVGRQTPLLALFVPLVLVGIVDGRRGVRQTWVSAVGCGLAFAVTQYVTSNFISVPLADVLASLVSAATVVALVRLGGPSQAPAFAGMPIIAGGAVDEPPPQFAQRTAQPDPPADLIRAYAPYAVITLVFVVCQIGPVKSALDKATRVYPWPGLHVVSASGKPLSLASFTLNYLTSPGTQMLVAGLLTMIALRVGPLRGLRTYGLALARLRWAILTVMAVLALAFVMNLSGQTITLGTWVAGAGGAFAFLSPMLGWFGTAMTGSDTSSNSLFGALQITAAGQTGLSKVLLAASNSSGGVLGKMVSPQNLVIAAAAVGLDGKEGDIFRKVVGWSLLFLLGMCALSALQSTGVLSWMVP
ncbi:MAG TPA: L-lactate permease [Actinocrinis sp.]|nr:L-lactate permease [Actinocrinis sp.]